MKMTFADLKIDDTFRNKHGLWKVFTLNRKRRNGTYSGGTAVCLQHNSMDEMVGKTACGFTRDAVVGRAEL